MAEDILPMALLPLVADLFASLERLAACWAVSAFFLVMEAISSRALVVSSSAAACSEAPWASAWLERRTGRWAERS